MSELRSFSVWIWWFHFPVQLQETNNFSTLVCQTGLQEDDCPWKWGSVHCDKLGFWEYTEVHRRAGIPLVLSSYGNHSCSMILLHSLKFGFCAQWGFSVMNLVQCGILVLKWLAFVTLTPWHMWTVALWIRFLFFIIQSWLHNCSMWPPPPCCSGSVA